MKREYSISLREISKKKEKRGRGLLFYDIICAKNAVVAFNHQPS